MHSNATARVRVWGFLQRVGGGDRLPVRDDPPGQHGDAECGPLANQLAAVCLVVCLSLGLYVRALVSGRVERVDRGGRGVFVVASACV